MVVSLLVGLVALVVLVLGLASMRPATFRIERHAVVRAEPERIFALIDNFPAWMAWSPWEKLDPAMRRTHGGSANGVGATYAWDGNKKVGSGRMEITESQPSSRLVVKLDFLKPFEAHNTAEFILTPAGEGTAVTWAMYGPSPLSSRVMGLVMDMDAMVGKDFEAGLANLKLVAEG